MANEKRYQNLGFNDDQCECSICGRQELKGTYHLVDLQDGSEHRAGSSCGARLLGVTVKEFESGVKEDTQREIAAFRSTLAASAEQKIYDTATPPIEATTPPQRMAFFAPLRNALKEKGREILKNYPLAHSALAGAY